MTQDGEYFVSFRIDNRMSNKTTINRQKSHSKLFKTEHTFVHVLFQAFGSLKHIATPKLYS